MKKKFLHYYDKALRYLAARRFNRADALGLFVMGTYWGYGDWIGTVLASFVFCGLGRLVEFLLWWRKRK